MVLPVLPQAHASHNAGLEPSSHGQPRVDEERSTRQSQDGDEQGEQERRQGEADCVRPLSDEKKRRPASLLTQTSNEEVEERRDSARSASDELAKLDSIVEVREHEYNCSLKQNNSEKSVSASAPSPVEFAPPRCVDSKVDSSIASRTDTIDTILRAHRRNARLQRGVLLGEPEGSGEPDWNKIANTSPEEDDEKEEAHAQKTGTRIHEGHSSKAPAGITLVPFERRGSALLPQSGGALDRDGQADELLIRAQQQPSCPGVTSTHLAPGATEDASANPPNPPLVECLHEATSGKGRARVSIPSVKSSKAPVHQKKASPDSLSPRQKQSGQDDEEDQEVLELAHHVTLETAQNLAIFLPLPSGSWEPILESGKVQVSQSRHVS